MLALAACGGSGSDAGVHHGGADLLAARARLRGRGRREGGHGLLRRRLRRRPAQIRAHLSPGDDFERLTVEDADGRTFTTTSRAKAVDWLVGRHAFDERLRLLSMQVAPGIDANHDAVAGAVSRIASDFSKRDITNRLYDFEGTVNCLRGSISRLQLQAPNRKPARARRALPAAARPCSAGRGPTGNRP